MSNAVNLVGFAWRSPLLPPNVLMLPVNPHQRKLPPTQNLNNYHRIDSDELDQLIYCFKKKINKNINTTEYRACYQFIALNNFGFPLKDLILGRTTKMKSIHLPCHLLFFFSDAVVGSFLFFYYFRYVFVKYHFK